MHMLIEVHHLEAVELVGNSLDLLLLALLLKLNAFSIPKTWSAFFSLKRSVRVGCTIECIRLELTCPRHRL